MAFVDLSGFTALTEAEGDERAVAELSTFKMVLRDICSRRAVRIAKWLGDGAMLVGVENRPVLNALLELVFNPARAPSALSVRAGASVGDVILHEGDDYIGHSVNVAARLCELAEGGHVLVTEVAAQALPRWGVARSSEEVVLRGIETPLRVVQAGLAPLSGWIQPDPVCGIPLDRSVAEVQDQDPLGRELWFCSESCHDTFLRRPAAAVDEPGSLRTPLIGT